MRSPLTVCHVRHATAGHVSKENAHPFVIERDDGSKLVGVHNGTLKDWQHKLRGQEFDVDSEWAFNMIADKGIEALKYFDGAYALVWHDTRSPESVFMVRNEQRPLHFMQTEDGKTVLGASELGMLGWLAERNGFKIKRDKNQNAMFYLSPGRLYEFSLKNVGEYTTEEVPKYDASTGVEKTTSNFTLTHHNSRGYSERYSRADDVHSDEDWRWGGGGDRAPVGMKERFSYYSTALQRVRDERLGHTKESVVGSVEEDPMLEAGIKAALDKWNGEQTGKDKELYAELLTEPVFLSDPKDSYATNQEKDTAKELKIYGQVVLTNTQMYEPDTATLLGEFEVMDESGVVFNPMSEMRFATRNEAYEYMDQYKPVVIVGYNKDRRNATASVAPLSKKQLLLVQNALLSRRKARAH